MGRSLQAWARLGGIRHLFTSDELDPMNAPALVATLEQMKRELVQFAANAEGLEKQFYDMVADLREEFAKKDPRLRIRYAAVLPETESETTH